MEKRRLQLQVIIASLFCTVSPHRMHHAKVI